MIAILIIGNEILSGRTQEKNIQVISTKLAKIGIEVSEVRIIPDKMDKIVKTITELASENKYVISTGGIGPTHDDITALAVSKAFNINLTLNQDAFEVIKNSYEKIGETLNEGRIKMAYVPEGSTLIPNDVSAAPGFLIQNVFVLAGIPKVMDAMMKYVLNYLPHCSEIISKSVEFEIGESKIAKELESLQNQYNEIDIGSYPFEVNHIHFTDVVIRGKNAEILNKAYDFLINLRSDVCKK